MGIYIGFLGVSFLHFCCRYWIGFHTPVAGFGLVLKSELCSTPQCSNVGSVLDDDYFLASF